VLHDFEFFAFVKRNNIKKEKIKTP
jgi:hypothetical protein